LKERYILNLLKRLNSDRKCRREDVRSAKHRNNVLAWALKFAQHYSSEKTLDLRTMPVRIPLATLIIHIDNYLTGGVTSIDRFKRFTESMNVVSDDEDGF